MAKFTSKYPELAFYCCGELRKFHNGEFSTEDEGEIKALESLTDAQRVAEPKVEPKAEAKPKAPAKKASGK